MTGRRFRDYFSDHSEVYARYRPQYPPELFAHLAAIVAARRWAWDCATGNGQAAGKLTPSFDHVIASDASERQIGRAAAHEKVEYVICRAESTPIRSHTIDLITVAQALHWFDFEKFYREVDRVLAPDGILAGWSYGWIEIDPVIDEIVNRYRLEIVGSYWPAESRYVAENYRSIPFPLKELTAPSLTMEATWCREELEGYLESLGKCDHTDCLFMKRKSIT